MKIVPFLVLLFSILIGPLIFFMPELKEHQIRTTRPYVLIRHGSVTTFSKFIGLDRCQEIINHLNEADGPIKTKMECVLKKKEQTNCVNLFDEVESDFMANFIVVLALVGVSILLIV